MRKVILSTFAFIVSLSIIPGCEITIPDDYCSYQDTVITEKFELTEDLLSTTINLHKTDIIATSGDNLLRLANDSLYMSNDLGASWKSLLNTIGDISFVHWFKDQSCLICGRSKSYWVDTSFSELHRSIVYDYNGEVLDDNSPHFYTSLHGHNDFELFQGKESLIWPDYFGDVNGYISRVWMTDDCGRTLKCICKNRETKDINGVLISCRHFHDCAIREGYNEIYITSGDNGNQCMLVKGSFMNDNWVFEIIGQGTLFKFDSVTIEDSYLYLLCDYTGYGKTGLLRVDISGADNINNYEYVYTCPSNLPLIRYYEIGQYSFIIYDGSVRGKILCSVDKETFNNLDITFDNKKSSISFLTNQNNAGQVLMRVGNGYDISNLKLNDCMYDFSGAMEDVGFPGFRKTYTWMP